MNIRERYHALCDGGLYAFERHEKAYRLPAVDHLLVPFARERLAGLRSLIDGADSADLAGDAFLVAELIYRYLEVRRDLSADLLQRRPDAVWRVVPQFRGGFGILALPGDPSGAVALVLRPAPDRNDGRLWELTRVTARPDAPGPAAATWTVTLQPEDRTNIGVIDTPADLEADDTLFAHLLSGLAAVTPRPVRRRA